jgi:hypothetical protein
LEGRCKRSFKPSTAFFISVENMYLYVLGVGVGGSGQEARGKMQEIRGKRQLHLIHLWQSPLDARYVEQFVEVVDDLRRHGVRLVLQVLGCLLPGMLSL